MYTEYVMCHVINVIIQSHCFTALDLRKSPAVSPFTGLGRVGCKEWGKRGKGAEHMPSDQSDQAVKIVIVDNRLVLNVEPKRKFPVLRSDNSITLYVNGQRKREPIIISNAEEIKFEIAEEKQAELFDLEVTQDKLGVYLTVNQLKKRRLRPVIIKDPGKIGDFLITTKEETTPSHHPVELEDVYRKLGEVGIQYGLNEAAIEQAIDNPGEKVLIAEGLAPVDSVDSVGG